MSDSVREFSEFRYPRQMLGEQEYDGHLSIHDDRMAEDLGFSGAPIEGPTHFSQFVHLLQGYFGDVWFERGCISSHYQNMVVEGEEVRAFIEVPSERADLIRIGSEKRDGTPVLTGTASIGPDYGDTEIDQRLARLRPVEQLVILSELSVGQQGAGNPEDAIMDHDQNMGALYPFSLNEKLERITETHDYYLSEFSSASPWQRPIVPLEMISVLASYNNQAGFKTRGPAVGLFAGQEIRMIKGPLFVGHPYKIEREIVALSESRRTESNWIRSNIYDAENGDLTCTMVLNSATLKDSYANYDQDAKALSKVQT
tara:strand:- start:2623 stop:3561 length:939 start_codon:yes stop_codon:yes gene_type:complete